MTKADLGRDDATINELQVAVGEFAAKRDWLQFHDPRNLAAAIVIEASELLECFQWRTEDACHREKLDEATLRSISSELADVVLYALNFANSLGLNLGNVVLEKLNENEGRFPTAG